MEKVIGRKNSLLVHAKNLGKNRNYRKEHGEFLCDGWKLFSEAILAKAEITTVFTSSDLELNLPENVKLFRVENDIINSLSPLKNPQDIIFICKMPPCDFVDFSSGTHILLDNVQDPGNVGTILRSAFAFGMDSVILTEGTADPYNPKAIRASMGAIFNQRLAFPEIDQLRSTSARFIATASNNDLTPVNYARLKDSIIVFGNEGQGISKGINALCEELITIPITPGAESLNVAIAASIIMWEARKEA